MVEKRAERAWVPPVNAGEVLRGVEVQDAGKKGDGVAFWGETGYVLFVPGGEVGRRYDVRVLKVYPKRAECAVVAEVLGGVDDA